MKNRKVPCLLLVLSIFITSASPVYAVNTAILGSLSATTTNMLGSLSSEQAEAPQGEDTGTNGLVGEQVTLDPVTVDSPDGDASTDNTPVEDGESANKAVEETPVVDNETAGEPATGDAADGTEGDTEGTPEPSTEGTTERVEIPLGEEIHFSETPIPVEIDPDINQDINDQEASTLNVEPVQFTVTVPTMLPATVLADGTVKTAANATVSNGSNDSVRVEKVTVTAMNGWTLVEEDYDFGSAPLNTKDVAVAVQGQWATNTGAVPMYIDDWPAIEAANEMGFSYNIKIPGVNKPLDAVALGRITFQVDWDDSAKLPDQSTATFGRPYDPSNPAVNEEGVILGSGFIYGENHGEYATFEIPTLMSTDGYSSVADTTNMSFWLYNRPLDSWTQLNVGSDIEFAPYDPNNANGDYTYGDFYADETGTFTGVKFSVMPKERANGEYTAAGTRFWNLMHDEGCLDNEHKTRLYVMATNDEGEHSKMTECWIRKPYTLETVIEHYGVNQPATMDAFVYTGAGDVLDINSYAEASPRLTFTTSGVDTDQGWTVANSWGSVMRVSSSEWFGDYAVEWTHAYEPVTLAIQIHKPGALTYTRTNLVLSPDLAESNYEPTTRTFRIMKAGTEHRDVIKLYQGDIDDDGDIDARDYELAKYWLFGEPAAKGGSQFISAYIGGEPGSMTKPGPDATPEELAEWARYLWNPDGQAYRANIRGNKDHLTIQSLTIVAENQGLDTTAYWWNGGTVEPNGMNTPT